MPRIPPPSIASTRIPPPRFLADLQQCFFEPLFPRLPIRQHLPKKGKKSRAVVTMNEVTQFVNNHVLDAGSWRLDQT